MNKSLLLFLFLLGGCSSLQTNCNGTKNWFEEGRKSYPENAESALLRLQKGCEDQISPVSFTEFKKGRDFQAQVSCTGSEKFPTSGWRALGEDMALRGDEEADYLKLASKCQLTPSTDELKEYKKAYQQSLPALCSKVGGMEFARKGHVYRSTCPKNKEKDFFTGQKIGLKMKEADEVNGEIRKLNDKIDELEKEIVKNENISSLCQDKISHAKADGTIETRYDECMVSKVSDAQFKIVEAKKIVRENKIKMLELKQELSRKKEDLDQKYKEIEIINNLLKTE